MSHSPFSPTESSARPEHHHHHHHHHGNIGQAAQQAWQPGEQSNNGQSSNLENNTDLNALLMNQSIYNQLYPSAQSEMPQSQSQQSQAQSEMPQSQCGGGGGGGGAGSENFMSVPQAEMNLGLAYENQAMQENMSGNSQAAYQDLAQGLQFFEQGLLSSLGLTDDSSQTGQPTGDPTGCGGSGDGSTWPPSPV
ncbi:MAG: hypothetical protein ACRD3W_12985, partial [Terriglobales bacterium]